MNIRPFREIKRRKTKEINVGNVKVGGDNPISVQSNTACAGQFSYFTLDNFFAGNLATHFIETGKKLEGSAFLFPSRMNHCVYPFYTSDDYRISIAGNYRFRV